MFHTNYIVIYFGAVMIDILVAKLMSLRGCIEVDTFGIKIRKRLPLRHHK